MEQSADRACDFVLSPLRRILPKLITTLVVALSLSTWSNQVAAQASCPTPSAVPAYSCEGGFCDNGDLNACPTTGSVGTFEACSITNYVTDGSYYGNIWFTSYQFFYNGPYDTEVFINYQTQKNQAYQDVVSAPLATGCESSDRNLGSTPCPKCGTGGSGTGDPINTSWGNEYEDETDFSGAPPYPLVFHRYYNSFGLGDSTIGVRWTHTYSRMLVQQTATLVQLFRDDGQILYFNNCSSGWCANADEIGTLTQATNSSGYTTGWTYTGDNDVVESYSANGQLLSETARGGMTHTLAYDSSGRLSTITDSFGRTLTLSYNTANQIDQITDPNGELIKYTYDASNNFSTVTYPDNTTREYFYNESGYVASGTAANLLTGIQDESGTRYASIYYDGQSRALQSTLADGVQDTQITYNSGGTATILDALGASRTFTFSTILSRNHLASISGGLCASCGINATYTYDANGNVSGTTDLNGNSTTHQFDLTRNLELTRTEGLTSAGASTTSTRTTTTQWWPNYREPQTINVYTGATATGTALRSTSFTYDGSGNQLTRTVTDPATGNTRTWTYT